MAFRRSRPADVETTQRLRPPSALLELTRPSGASEGTVRVDSIPWAAFASQEIDPENDQRPTAPAPFWLASVHGMAAYLPPVTIINAPSTLVEAPRPTSPSAEGLVRAPRRTDGRRLVALLAALTIVAFMLAFARAFA